MSDFMRRVTRVSVTALLGFAGAVFAVGPDPSQPYIQAISYGGSGCPQGTVGQSISNDRQTFTLIFDTFIASTGPNVPATENSKTCEVTLRLHLAPGWQTWSQSFARRGYVQLSAGSTATAGSTVVMNPPSASGHSNGDSGINQTSQNNFTGPVAKDYLGADGASITAHAPNTCNEVPERVQDLKITVQVGATGSQQGQVTTDSLDGKLVVTSLAKSKACQ